MEAWFITGASGIGKKYDHFGSRTRNKLQCSGRLLQCSPVKSNLWALRYAGMMNYAIIQPGGGKKTIRFRTAISENYSFIRFYSFPQCLSKRPCRLYGCWITRKSERNQQKSPTFWSRQNPFGSLETRMAPSSFTPLQVAHVRWIDASPTGQREFTVGRPLTHDARKLSQNAAGNE